MAFASSNSGKASERAAQVTKRIVAAVPKVLPSKDAAAGSSADAQVRYQAMCDAIGLLVEHADHILLLKGLLEQRVGEFGQRSEDAWAKTPKYVGHLDKNWCAAWIVKYDESASPAGKRMDREFLDAIESSDSKAIHNLFQLFTGTGPYQEVPVEAQQSKNIAALVFTRRAQDIGSFVKGYREHKCAAGGLDPRRGGAYSLKFEGPDGGAQLCTEITFIGGEKVAVDTNVVRNTPGFIMSDPFSITRCSVSLGMACYRLYDSFPPGHGPKSVIADVGTGRRSGASSKEENPLVALAKAVSADLAKAKQDIEKGFIQEDDAFVGQARRTRLADNLRQASAKAQALGKRRRTVALS